MKTIIQRTCHLAGASLALAMCLGHAVPAHAGSGTVTVILNDSSAGGLAGGIVEYYKGGWQPLGTTDGSGMVSGLVTLTGTTTDFQIRYKGGAKKWVGINVTTGPTLTISTIPVTVKLETCPGTPLLGEAKYYFGGWTTFGGGATPATLELLPNSYLGPGVGSYDFQVKYGGRTSVTIRQDISVNPVVVFKTTKVTLSGGNIFYYNGGWQSFISPMEMVGTSADFKFGNLHNPTKTLAISGCEVTGGVLTLHDEAGHGLAGGKATPAIGGSWQPTLPGATDASGQLWFAGGEAWTKIKMTVNQSGQEQTKAQLTASGYFYQTATATINVKHSDGAGFAGVIIDQGGGIWVMGIATTNGSGVAKVPMFAGSAKFRAKYNNTAQEITQAVPSTFVFQTGQVHSDAGTCTQWATGSWNTFTQDMEVFPGTYKFVFSDYATTFYPVAGGAVNHIH